MTENTRILRRFEYHAEDLDCYYCVYKKRKSKKHKNGCREETCRYEDIRREAIANGRNERARGWFKCLEE